MYAQFFGLTKEPFSIAPDPRFLFMSERHREALAHLLYGLGGGGGFVLLTGEIGAGKTTVCRCFLEQIPRRCNVAYIFNPKLTATELLKSVCDEFRIPFEHEGPGTATVKDYIDPINEFLLRTHAVGQNNVLIIDEAQNLSAEVLEQLRLLTNLETNERKLLQIVLIGQPELRDMVARPDLEQLAQRVVARFHLGALSEAETAQYIRHRMAVAGLNAGLPFNRAALRRIHQLTGGVPRRINLLCDRALLGCYATSQSMVDRRIVDQAASEVFGQPSATRWGDPERTRKAAWGIAVFAGVAVLLIGARLYSDSQGRGSPAVAMANAPSAAAAPAPAPQEPSAAVEAPAPSGDAMPPTQVATAPVASETREPPAASAIRFDALTRSESDAWRELARMWGLQLAQGDPCQMAQQAEVHCFKGRTNLAEIRQLGRPGIVTLQHADGRDAYALLIGLSADEATLEADGVGQAVTLDALSRAWRGDFATLWRAPPGYRVEPIDGRSGPVVDWLARHLAELDREAPPSGRAVFDAPLKARVHSFQAAQGLTPDGVPGPKTFMQLNRATGVDEPRLRAGHASH